MSELFDKMQPQLMWHYFGEILKIPRPSKKEEAIREYIKKFSVEYGLSFKEDHAGNLVVSKPATKGMEGRASVALQSHLDMVCEKNSDVQHDFEKDPILPREENGWIKATGTTLGADNGVGIAIQLALLASTDLAHGPIECLFTVDEETGLTGACELSKELLSSRYLVNLDSEEWGEITIGCAGGRQTTVSFDYLTENTPAGTMAFKISVTGLKGGHSGDEIHKGLGNSIKLLNRILYHAHHQFGLRLSTIDGGNLHNAIPREAFALVVVPVEFTGPFNEWVHSFNLTAKNELSVRAPELNISMEKSDLPLNVIDVDTQYRLIYSLLACPHGEMAWSAAIPGLVETSTNLATVKTKDRIIILTSQRSSVASSLDNICNMVRSVFVLGGAKTESNLGYPGWEPRLDSTLLNICKQSYKDLFGIDPVVKAIHAGLECGLIGEKYPGMEMISVGPTMKNVHSPDEMLEIKSTSLFWSYLLDILKHMPEKNNG